LLGLLPERELLVFHGVVVQTHHGQIAEHVIAGLVILADTDSEYQHVVRNLTAGSRGFTVVRYTGLAHNVLGPSRQLLLIGSRLEVVDTRRSSLFGAAQITHRVYILVGNDLYAPPHVVFIHRNIAELYLRVLTAIVGGGSDIHI